MLLLKSFLLRSLLEWAIVYDPNFPFENLVDLICFKTVVAAKASALLYTLRVLRLCPFF